MKLYSKVTLVILLPEGFKFFFHLCSLLPTPSQQLHQASRRRSTGRRTLHGSDFTVSPSFNDPRRELKRREEPAVGVDPEVGDLTRSFFLERKRVGGSIPGWEQRRRRTSETVKDVGMY